MIDILVYGVASAALFWSVLEFLKGIKLYSRIVIKYPKPFGCALCFTFWMTILCNISELNYTTLLIAGIAAVSAEAIDRHLV